MLRIPVIYESEVEPLLSSLAKHLQNLDIELDLRHHTERGDLQVDLIVAARRPGSQTFSIEHPGLVELHFSRPTADLPGEHVYLADWPARSADPVVRAFAKRLKAGTNVAVPTPAEASHEAQTNSAKATRAWPNLMRMTSSSRTRWRAAWLVLTLTLGGWALFDKPGTPSEPQKRMHNPDAPNLPQNPQPSLQPLPQIDIETEVEIETEIEIETKREIETARETETAIETETRLTGQIGISVEPAPPADPTTATASASAEFDENASPLALPMTVHRYRCSPPNPSTQPLQREPGDELPVP